MVFQWISFIRYGFGVQRYCSKTCSGIARIDFLWWYHAAPVVAVYYLMSIVFCCKPVLVMHIQYNRNTAHLTIHRFNEYFLEIKDEDFTLFPTSFTENITSETASFSLYATYGCINLPVYFKWFVVVSLFLFEIC